MVHHGPSDRRVLREFCAENFTNVPAAIAAGADRIELCDNLAVGGTSVSPGVLDAVIAHAHAHSAAVFAMIRPRGGSFCYDETEAAIMATDTQVAVEHGVDGIVLGALTDSHWIDQASLAHPLQIATAAGVDMTFHMAFDLIDASRQPEAIDLLCNLGVTRILTHGGDLRTPIHANYEHLRRLVNHAQGKLGVVIGGGVTDENASQVVAATGASEIHGTRIVRL